MPDGTYTCTNTEIFLVIPSLNSFVQNRIGNYDTSTNTFLFGDDGSRVPVGIDYKIVVITNKNGSYSYYETSGTATAADVNITAAMAAETLPYITGKIHAL